MRSQLLRNALIGCLLVLVARSVAAQGDCNNPPIPDITTFGGTAPHREATPAWWALYSDWCKKHHGTPHNGQDGQWCDQGPDWDCGKTTDTSSSNSTSSTPTGNNPLMAGFELGQRIRAEANARDEAIRNKVTDGELGTAATEAASESAEISNSLSKEAQTHDAARLKRDEESRQAFGAAKSASDSFLQNISGAGSEGESKAGKSAWKQVHCLAYVSQIAFVDLALNDYRNFRDTAAEASRGFNGQEMDVECPNVRIPRLKSGSSAQLENVKGTLKKDLELAKEIADRREKDNPEKIVLPPVPPEFAKNPENARAWKTQQALNAIDNQPSPCNGKSPEDCAAALNDRQKTKDLLMDSYKVTKNLGVGFEEDSGKPSQNTNADQPSPKEP